MIIIRKAEERGSADYGWLKTYYTFSFNNYYDQNHMGFRSLRVINDDLVSPGQGFGKHPHNDMEILTYIIEGALEHKDSMGNGSVIKPGDIQRMSAGTGVLHSEFNPSESEPVHLLQIWIIPNQQGIKPSYEQINIKPEDKKGRLCLIASEDGSEGSVKIHQDVKVYATELEKSMKLRIHIEPERHGWIQTAKGQLQLNGIDLKAGDGAGISDEGEVILSGVDDSSEVLYFDLG